MSAGWADRATSGRAASGRDERLGGVSPSSALLSSNSVSEISAARGGSVALSLVYPKCRHVSEANTARSA